LRGCGKTTTIDLPTPHVIFYSQKQQKRQKSVLAPGRSTRRGAETLSSLLVRPLRSTLMEAAPVATPSSTSFDVAAAWDLVTSKYDAYRPLLLQISPEEYVMFAVTVLPILFLLFSLPRILVHAFCPSTKTKANLRQSEYKVVAKEHGLLPKKLGNANSPVSPSKRSSKVAPAATKSYNATTAEHPVRGKVPKNLNHLARTKDASPVKVRPPTHPLALQNLSLMLRYRLAPSTLFPSDLAPHAQPYPSQGKKQQSAKR
jgi:hypothetical protein